MKGFTLIELVIVLAIIGILTAIAYPSYQEYIIRERRHEGQSALLELANRMELYYAERHQYPMLPATQSKQYRLTVTDASINTFTLKATPIAAQGQLDKLCQTLTLNHLGQKGIESGPMGEPNGIAAHCW